VNVLRSCATLAHLTIYPLASQLGVFSPFGNSNLFRVSIIRISNFPFRRLRGRGSYLIRSETLNMFHSQVLPLSGEKA
jgi:hypothetical protein